MIIYHISLLIGYLKFFLLHLQLFAEGSNRLRGLLEFLEASVHPKETIHLDRKIYDTWFQTPHHFLQRVRGESTMNEFCLLIMLFICTYCLSYFSSRFTKWIMQIWKQYTSTHKIFQSVMEDAADYCNMAYFAGILQYHSTASNLSSPFHGQWYYSNYARQIMQSFWIR